MAKRYQKQLKPKIQFLLQNKQCGVFIVFTIIYKKILKCNLINMNYYILYLSKEFGTPFNDLIRLFFGSVLANKHACKMLACMLIC